MRVVAGTHGGRILHAPRGRNTRPTSDRVREAVFSMLGPLEGVAVLDLFAGSGAMGIEALSRGAERAVFVDSDAAAVACITRNLAELGLADRARVVRADWRAALAAEQRAKRCYGLCVIDPPYTVLSGIGATLMRALASLIPAGGRIVIEGSARQPPLDLSGLPVDQRTDRQYGTTRVTVVHCGNSDEK
ncbi:MAG: 16S rRNA (guanine(966)-N(2))-methyltransferase RsmD [Thermoleophilia bacterium]